MVTIWLAYDTIYHFWVAAAKWLRVPGVVTGPLGTGD